MVSTALQERHTSAMLMWQQALRFATAANQLGNDDTPALFLACHGLELALKSYLRAKGFRIGRLRQIGHSLVGALDECLGQGLEEPPEDVNGVIEFAELAHEQHEFRYGHLYHPIRIELRPLMIAAAWALETTSEAVAKTRGTDATTGQSPLVRMRLEAQGLRMP